MSTPGFHLFTAVFVVAAGAVTGPALRRASTRPRLIRAAVLGCVAVGLPASVWSSLQGAPGWAATVAVTTTLLLAGVTAAALSLRRPVSAVPVPRRVLVIGAHPDDVELACGATVAKLADSGHEIHALVMSRGENGGRADSRDRAAASAGALLGVARLEQHCLPDTGLAACEAQLVEAIEAVMRRFNPDLILTHSAHDQHADHRAVHLATLQAARRHPAILCYESPSATAAFDPRVFIDVEGYLGVKLAAVAAHRDQRGKPYMSAERVRAQAVFRGGQARLAQAEGFEPVRLAGTLTGER